MRASVTSTRWHSSVDSQLIRYAREAAQTTLSTEAPEAWERSVRAGALADQAVTALDRPRGEIIIASAWLHAIGDSPSTTRTGCWPIDGAVHLLAEGWPTPVVNLVAHHAQARLIAPAWDATERLALFERIQGWPSDILDYSIVMAMSAADPPDPEYCVRLAGKQVPASLRISARDRAERERRLRRAVDRVHASIIAAQAATPATA